MRKSDLLGTGRWYVEIDRSQKFRTMTTGMSSLWRNKHSEPPALLHDLEREYPGKLCDGQLYRLEFEEWQRVGRRITTVKARVEECGFSN